VRFADDGEGRLRLGRARRRHCGAACARRLHGAPALTIERDEVRDFWNDLGTRWRIREQYFKAYPVCRWAQPASRRRSRCSARTLRGGRHHGAVDRELPRSDRPRVGVRDGDDDRGSAVQPAVPIAAALVFGDIGPPK
jgi:hypothetical protein